MLILGSILLAATLWFLDLAENAPELPWHG